MDSSSDGGDDEERSELLGWVCRRLGFGFGRGLLGWVCLRRGFGFGFGHGLGLPLAWVGFGRELLGWVWEGMGNAGEDGYG